MPKSGSGLRKSSIWCFWTHSDCPSSSKSNPFISCVLLCSSQHLAQLTTPLHLALTLCFHVCVISIMMLPVALLGVLSAISRYHVEGDPVAFLVDHAVLAICTLWMPSSWVRVPFSLVAFLALAFYQTRAEFARPEETDREEHGMCPVLSRKPGVPHTISSLARPPGCPSLSASLTEFRSSSRGNDEPRELHGRPTLFPCDLRHKRIGPFQDAFRHAYLYCGIPIGFHACYSPILCVDQPTDTTSRWPFRKAWFNMRAEDHLIRGGAHLTMAQKLREFLLSEVTSLRSTFRFHTFANHVVGTTPRERIQTSGHTHTCSPRPVSTGRRTTHWASGISTRQTGNSPPSYSNSTPLTGSVGCGLSVNSCPQSLIPRVATFLGGGFARTSTCLPSCLQLVGIPWTLLIHVHPRNPAIWTSWSL